MLGSIFLFTLFFVQLVHEYDKTMLLMQKLKMFLTLFFYLFIL